MYTWRNDVATSRHPVLPIVGFCPLLDIYIDRGCGKHVTINVTEASAGLEGYPPPPTTFKRHVHPSPPPLADDTCYILLSWDVSN